jgi:predicted dehydrogenase
MTIKVGVIGCGKIGDVGHLTGYKECPNAEVIAVADVNEKAAKAMAEKYHVPRYFTDYRELLKLMEIEAVSVAVPNFLHAEMTIAACKAGKHVLCEKPMATSIKEAKAMVEAAQKNKVLLEICMAHRYTPQAQAAKKVLESGMLGKINSVVSVFGSPGPEFWSPEGKWFFNKKLAMGGAMADLGIHLIDVVRYLVGSDVAKVSGFTAIHEKKGDVDDSGVCSMMFKNGTLGTLYSSWTYKPGGMSITLFCEKGTLYFGRTPINDKPIVVQLINPPSTLIPEIAPVSEIGTRYQHFIDCIEKGKSPVTNGMEGLKALEVILSVYKSMETGKVINLS